MKKKGVKIKVFLVRLICIFLLAVVQLGIEGRIYAETPHILEHVTWEYKSLCSVKLVAQTRLDWCGYACGEMISKAIGKHKTQCQLASLNHGKSNLEYCCGKAISDEECIGNEPPFTKAKIARRWKGNIALKWRQIRGLFEDDRPICFAWNWLRKAKIKNFNRHFLVSRGFVQYKNIKLVIVYDPVPVNHGTKRIMTYDEYERFPAFYLHAKSTQSLPRAKEKVSIPFLRKYCPKPPPSSRLRNISSDAVAQESLKLLKCLPEDVLDELGILSRAEARKCRLVVDNQTPAGIPVKKIMSNLFKKYQDKLPLVAARERGVEKLYFVSGSKGEKLITSIVVRKRGAKWHFAMFAQIDSYIDVNSLNMEYLGLKRKPLLTAFTEKQSVEDKLDIPFYLLEFPDLYLVLQVREENGDISYYPTNVHPAFKIGEKLTKRMLLKRITELQKKYLQSRKGQQK